MMTTTTTWFIVLLVGLATVIAVAALAHRQRRLRHARLHRQFGPEYERALQQYGSVSRADRALDARAKRVRQFHFHDLNEADRARFEARWGSLQALFIDDPPRAVRDANELVKDVMVARGYPSNDFDQRVADLSVDHANVVEHYRAARALADSSQRGEGTTEDLRQAVVHYRALFAELVESDAAARASQQPELGMTS
jgi:hypothetical protein